MMRIWMACLLALFLGCDDGGSGDEGGEGGAGMNGAGGAGGVMTGPPMPIEGDAPTLATTAIVDRMRAVAEAPGIAKGNIGDPAQFTNSEADTPSDDTALSSLYYEGGDLEAAVGRTRDRRPEVTQDDNVGSRIQNQIASALTIGWASDTPSGRGGPRWHALTAALSLDHYLLLAVYAGLSERSAAGYDRALGVLWDADGAPHGLGQLIAKADAFCGTTILDEIASELSTVRAPFIAELENSGLPDSLQRLVIEEGALPAYDAAITTVTRLTAEGMQRLFAAELQETDFNADRQARALMRYAAIAPWLAPQEIEGADTLSAVLDAANPADVDIQAVLDVLAAAGTPCDR